MNDRFNATTGSSAQRSEVHPGRRGTASAAAIRPRHIEKDVIASTSNHTIYTVASMTCAHCVASVTEEVSEIPGVENVQVDLASGAVAVTSKTWQNGQTVTRPGGTRPTSAWTAPTTTPFVVLSDVAAEATTHLGIDLLARNS